MRLLGVKWVQAPNRATNSRFSVYDGATLLNTVAVDQTLAPTGFYDYGVSFVSLGQAYAINSGKLVVKLSNNGVAANASVVADAIRINRIGNPASGAAMPFFTSPDGGAAPLGVDDSPTKSIEGVEGVSVLAAMRSGDQRRAGERASRFRSESGWNAKSADLRPSSSSLSMVRDDRRLHVEYLDPNQPLRRKGGLGILGS